ncbi:MAG: NAD(P)/FAD-dependent oxidoreductase [Gammaproteobacteria bacterium]|uniref:flavin-containing monooxygenase n=1 Tax=Pseudomaricurvus alcaniphilus TaxID=1166482 RepID=UPI00140E2324|nr:NAD(P)/FAD-dependent oxidoreductase [Pseudomaricurvus alcaniphilus]MBR9910637.1 NAD(P)/FAD-dependent oxidoreductase [Gammaproteobacteria bacterium]NHN36839.1 NAD(P)/FAD-dependent oxidoreductase [Pseudomaricurvus alcaniphilus]
MTQNAQSNRLRYVIVGAGMAGMLAGIKLLQRGVTNFAIYEKADRIGGTWRENTYPGLTCDVPSHSYTYSFEPYPDWTCLMPSGAEIQEYFEKVRVKYGLDDYLHFKKEITTCEYVEGKWCIQTACGHKDYADIVIAATGVLHHPRIPEIEGMDSFNGAIFHSARWDHSVPPDGRRIAVIGTGSTGVQIVSALSKIAAQLTHFQRTPQWIMPVENRPFTNEEKAAFHSDPEILKRMQNDPELEANIERFSAAITDPESDAMKQIDELVLNNLEQSVKDPELREKLRPDYKPACKRLIYSPDFYEAVQRPNVEVVVEGVDRIEPEGIRSCDGQLHEFDVIVLATGFRADMFVRPAQVKGRGGVSLDDVWGDSPQAYMAIMIPDFPNFFMLNGPGGPVGNFSLIEIAEHQWNYVEQLIRLVEGGDCREVCVTSEAFEQFERDRIAAAKHTIFATGCDSWYLDARGIPATWPWTRQRFKQEMAAPKPEALELN